MLLQAGDKEILWVMRFSVIVVAIIASTIAILSDSVYDLL